MRFFAKVRSLPVLLMDFPRIVVGITRVSFEFYQKHKRRPTEQELYEISLPFMAKTRIFRQDQSNFEQIVGMTAITWAIIEHTVDLINAISITRAGGHELGDYLPQSLKPKLALFKRSFEGLGSLNSFKERGLTIHENLNELKEYRHDLIHGIASQRLLSGGREILRHSYRGAKLLPQAKPYTMEEIIQTMVQLFTLRNELRRLLTDIDAALPKDMIDDARG